MANGCETQFSEIFDQIVAYAAGNPLNVVNPQALSIPVDAQWRGSFLEEA
jgi:hypothetical protein